jgi:signal transduction histidine kinase
VVVGRRAFDPSNAESGNRNASYNSIISRSLDARGGRNTSMISEQKTLDSTPAETAAGDHKNLSMAAALASRIGDPLSRGRRVATELRTGLHMPLAELIDELCDDLERVSRQFLRLGLDLHDEALQDLAALRNDLGLFHDQVSSAFEASDSRSRVVGRVDDFLARVINLDRVLRGVMASAEGAPVLRHPLSVTLESVVDAYPGSCEVESVLDSTLDHSDLTDSQCIALVRIVQSALANVAQHSEATRACVTVECREQTVRTEIVDNGIGFDVDEAFQRALAERRLGLVGMAERVRLLGGTFSVVSGPGGPTHVFFELPRRTT